MNPVVWQQCKEIFQNALDLEPDERIAYLNSQNLTKDAHREVTAMLAAAAADLAPWEAPALQHLSGACGISTDLQVGELVGPYRILRQIGRGGMGSVYLAERADGRYERLVALKLLRSGFGLAAGPSLLHRETSILATFDHPNIARILDAGVIGDAGVTNDTGVINNAGVIGSGLEYLVIEYVDGANLVDYCTQHDLPLRERVRLFADCCSAVQYVHQHLIIHRDIKPGNILVSPLGVPKLLDFGIAKVLSSGFADGWQADRSETFAPCFTPQYASPEQFRGEPLSVATDIYSLGVLFCEVLTGMNPRADPGKAASTNLPQLAVAVCEREPAPPSALLPPRSKLREHLRGDLDNIAIKALQKHPDSRYPSAQAFQDDLNRYLQGFPVTAKELTWTYRASKFIRRRALPISGVALISITLLTTTILAVRQRDDAQRRFQQVRGLADSILFRLDNAIETLPGSTPARKLEVESALTYLDGLANDATKDRDLQVDRAAAYLKIGDIQGNPFEPNLGDPAGAAESYRKARRILDGISATGSDDATRKLVLAAYYQRLGDMGGHPMGGHLDTQAAIAAYRSAQELIRVSGVPASRAPGGLLADLPVHLAYELMLAEQSNEALAVLRPAIAAERTALKADPGDIGLERKLGEAYNMLAIVYMDTEPAKALSAFAMARRELTTGGDTARTPWPYARLVAESHWRSGDIYYSARRYDRAGEEYSIAVQSLEQLLQIDASNERVRDDLSRVLTRMARVVRRQEGIPQSDALRMHALEILRSSKAAASDEPPVDSATSSCPAALPAMAASPGEHRNPLLAPGNFLVTDLKAERTGALILIDARSGAQSVIASGGYFANPHSSLIESDGNVLVADADAFGGNGGIIRLRFDPPSGGWRQEPVSCGGLFRDPVSVVLAPNSKLWVADFDGANDFHGAIIEVDPVSGAQRFLSRDQHLAQFNQIVLSPTRSILLGNYWGRDGGPAEILSIDPATGQQRVLSQFGLMEDPSVVVVAPDGSLLVSEGNVDGPSSPGALFRIDPKSGAQHVISSGGLLSNPVSLVMETPTSVVIADEGNGINAGYGTSVIRINIRTGAQQLVAMGRPMVAAGGIAITGAR